MDTGAVIIAEGTTSHGKLIHPMKTVGSVSAISRLVETFQQTDISRIVLVTTKQNLSEMEKHVARRGVVCLSNRKNNPAEMFDLAKIGLTYLQDKCRRVFLTPVDTPLFTADTVRRLLTDTNAPVANPVYKDKAGHPLLLSANLIPSILRYEGQSGLRGAIRQSGAQRAFVEVSDSGILCNVGAQTDFTEALEHYNRQSLHPIIKLRLVKELPFFGPGTAQLVSLIEDTGSVRFACQQMGISYSKGWKMISLMEEQFGKTIVVRQQGGKNGGTAYLTNDGKELLEKFRLLESRSQILVQQAFNEIFCSG